RGLLSSAHDCSDGGLAVALAECVAWGGLGLNASGWEATGRLDTVLFGEAQSRFVVSFAPAAGRALEQLADEHRVPLTLLGTAGGTRFRLGPSIDLAVNDVIDALEGGLERGMRSQAL